jgi:hypothetical protein
VDDFFEHTLPIGHPSLLPLAARRNQRHPFRERFPRGFTPDSVLFHAL